MTIRPIQLNINFKADSSEKNVKPYLEAEGRVGTKKRTKPLPPEGYLVDDNLITGTKYFFKDIKYDIKSLKNGYIGTANDHQLGRLNDVGLRLGGIAIATYLATQTTNPKVRLMEYIGLATFLTAMSVYPKLAINAPARIVHGFDIDKEYIDDQGRKKSVFQDSNYIPYDMYNGKLKDEDLDTIGDKMGIPRNIKNRHDLIKEQMRKIATQNNTLWMLTAGFATPLITALVCSGVEKYIVSPGVEKARNAKYNAKIESMLAQVGENAEIGKVNNSLGDSVKRILSKYEGKLLPNDELNRITELLTQQTDSGLALGIKADIEKLLSGGSGVIIDEKILKTMYEKAGNAMLGAQTDFIYKNILPTEQEIKNIIKQIKPDGEISKGIELTGNEFEQLKTRIFEFSNGKIEALSGEGAKHKDYLHSNVIKFKNAFEAENSKIITKESTEKLTKFANIIGDFKKKAEILDNCINFKFEHTPDSVLANYYNKFQSTLMKYLDISPKDYKRMSNDKAYTQKILDEKISSLCQNEAKYKEMFKKLGKIMSDMENTLHGKAQDSSHIKNLITGIENVYNNTAKSLIESSVGENTSKLISKGALTIKIESKEDLYKLLEGISENKYTHANPNEIEAMKYFANDKATLKNIKISRLISRYQGEVNSFNRIMQTIDFYKRAANPDELIKLSSIQDKEYVSKIEKTIKDSLLKGSISDFTMKLGIENPYTYRDFYNIGWTAEAQNYGKTIQKGVLTDSTKGALKEVDEGIVARLQRYITRFKNIIANDPTDFTKPNHILDGNISRNYSDFAKTNEAKFNLVAQSPVDMVQKASEKMHADRMWLKTVGIMTGVVLGVTLLAQFGFGKIKNKNNIQQIDNSKSKNQKRVKHDNDK